jgi:hypothetical protein
VRQDFGVGVGVAGAFGSGATCLNERFTNEPISVAIFGFSVAA